MPIRIIWSTFKFVWSLIAHKINSFYCFCNNAYENLWSPTKAWFFFGSVGRLFHGLPVILWRSSASSPEDPNRVSLIFITVLSNHFYKGSLKRFNGISDSAYEKAYGAPSRLLWRASKSLMVFHKSFSQVTASLVVDIEVLLLYFFPYIFPINKKHKDFCSLSMQFCQLFEFI